MKDRQNLKHVGVYEFCMVFAHLKLSESGLSSLSSFFFSTSEAKNVTVAAPEGGLINQTAKAGVYKDENVIFFGVKTCGPLEAVFYLFLGVGMKPSLPSVVRLFWRISYTREGVWGDKKVLKCDQVCHTS